jgi:hypothetical protein
VDARRTTALKTTGVRRMLLTRLLTTRLIITLTRLITTALIVTLLVMARLRTIITALIVTLLVVMTRLLVARLLVGMGTMLTTIILLLASCPNLLTRLIGSTALILMLGRILVNHNERTSLITLATRYILRTRHARRRNKPEPGLVIHNLNLITIQQLETNLSRLLSARPGLEMNKCALVFITSIILALNHIHALDDIVTKQVSKYIKDSVLLDIHKETRNTDTRLTREQSNKRTLGVHGVVGSRGHCCQLLVVSDIFHFYQKKYFNFFCKVLEKLLSSKKI